MKRFSLFLLSLFVLTACGADKEELPVNDATDDEVVVEDVQLEPGDEEVDAPTVSLDNAADGGLTMEVVAANNDASSCYTVIDGGVYNLTTWIEQHPGGAENILKICGIDGSNAFNGKHGGNEQAKAELSSHYIGDLM